MNIMTTIANKAAKKFALHLAEVFAVNLIAAAAGEVAHAVAEKVRNRNNQEDCCESHCDAPQEISLEDILPKQNATPQVVVNVNSNNKHKCCKCGEAPLPEFDIHPDDCDCGECSCIKCGKDACECK